MGRCDSQRGSAELSTQLFPPLSKASLNREETVYCKTYEDQRVRILCSPLLLYRPFCQSWEYFFHVCNTQKTQQQEGLYFTVLYSICLLFGTQLKANLLFLFCMQKHIYFKKCLINYELRMRYTFRSLFCSIYPQAEI